MQITQHLNEITKNLEHTFVAIGKKKSCAKFQQETFSSMVVEARQGFNFLDKIPGFSKTIELRLNFGMGFCVT